MNASAKERFVGVRLVAFDVDGVFTDGRFYLSDDGVEMKAFSTQDGFGVRSLLKAGYEVAIISGRASNAVEKRMAELEVPHVILGVNDKAAAFDTLCAMLDIAPEEALYVGDDIPDLPLLAKVGVSVAVANAVSAVREYCDITTTASGGHGAVREVCELVLARRHSEQDQ